MLDDWRLAARSAAQRRGSSLAIVLTLALGIGGNSAIFSAVDTVLLKPLPYPESDRLVSLYEAKTDDVRRTGLVAPAKLEEWQRLNRSFDGLAGCYFENVTDTSGPLPERVAAMRTSPRFFSVLATPPAIGRATMPAEEIFGGPPVVVLSDSLWRARFNADPTVIGRPMVLGGVSRTIIGVMPPSFRYPSTTTEAWIPAQMSAGLLGAREARFLTTVGRLKPGVTVTQAHADLAAIQERLGEQFPKTDRGWTAAVVPLKEEQIGGVRRSLWLLFGAVFLVLLAACGNIACLLLAGAARREHEIAVRFALGATRASVVRQMLREGLILSAIGSIGALIVARWAIDTLRGAAASLPRVAELHVDARLVLFTLTLGAATTMLFALAPAVQTTRAEVVRRLAHGARGHIAGRQVLPRVLVAAQVSLAIVLLVGAGLLVRSFIRLQDVSPGFDADHVLTFRISSSWNERPEAVVNRQLRTIQRLAAVPGVVSVSLNSGLPAAAGAPPGEFRIAGRESEGAQLSLIRSVSADYFRTLRIPVLHGETCRDVPRPDAPPKVVISQAFAERYFPGENPLGRHIVQRVPAEIVAVVADVRERGLMNSPEPLAYHCGLMPFWPDPFYIIRVDPARGVKLSAIREAVREIEPGRAVYGAAALRATLSSSLAQPRLNTILLVLFAAMTLILAAVGLYGMLAQFVAQRRREIGLRLALGAPPGRVLGHVLRFAAAIAGAGLVVGIGCAFALAQLMGALVFGISPRDPVTFALVPVTLTIVGAVATVVPLRRAIRIDPIEALREE